MCGRGQLLVVGSPPLSCFEAGSLILLLLYCVLQASWPLSLKEFVIIHFQPPTSPPEC